MNDQKLRERLRQILFSESRDQESVFSLICQEYEIEGDDLRDLLNQSDDLDYMVDRVIHARKGDLRRTREQMIEMVEKIIKGEGTKGEVDEWFRILEANVEMPIQNIVDLIFYPEDGRSPVADEVIDKAIAYEPEITLL